MLSHTLHTYVGSDGILKVEMPIAITNSDLEVILIVNPLHPIVEWSPSFFTEILGAWEGSPLVREPQGSYELRSGLK